MEPSPFQRLVPPARGSLLAAVLAVIAGCGGHTEAHIKADEKPAAVAAKGKTAKKDAAAPAASAGLRDFDAGLRALKLGGPEANERAAESFQRAVAADPTLWEAWYNLGVTRWHMGDDRGATAAFSKAIELSPSDRNAHLARGEAYRRMRKFGEARADYEAVFTKDPNDLASRLRYASLLRESGDSDGSTKAVREILKRNAQGKDLADANVELGLDYLAANRVELAQLVFSKAAQLDPKNPRVWNAVGLLALKQGKDQDAFRALDHATDLDPSFRDARFNKATVLLDAGDYGQAKTELLAALRGQEDGADLDALVALGVAYRGLSDYQQAKGTWDRVLKVAPMQPDALYDMGVLEMDFLKDEGKAREYLTRYTAAAPDDHPRQKDAQQRIGQLEPAPAPAAPAAATPAAAGAGSAKDKPGAPKTPAPATPAQQKPPAKPKKRRRRRRRFLVARRGRRSGARALPLAVGLIVILFVGLAGTTASAAPKRGKKAPAKPAAAAPSARPSPSAVPAPAPAEAPEGSATATVTIDPKATSKKEKTFDFAAMGIEGKVLAPQLLYLLGRIKVELEKGSLEGRSFIPELIRSVDEGGI